MIHYFENNNHRVTLVLLHGTGGDEKDLVPLAHDIDQKYNILSLRGRINEGGMLRFFKRFDMHTFDLENAKQEADYILNFLKDAKKKYKLKELILLGYSNGASMIEALLLEESNLFSGAVLLQPGLLKTDIVFPLNKDFKVFLSASDNDPYLPVNRQKILIEALSASYDLSVSKHTNGHGLTATVLHDLRKWLK
ncbi:MAG: hypothetical protein WC968_01235 [Bacilli bacterium]